MCIQRTILFAGVAAFVFGWTGTASAQGQFDGVWKGRMKCEHIVLDSKLNKKVFLTVKGASATFKSNVKKGFKVFPGSGEVEYDGDNAEVSISGEGENVRAETALYKFSGDFKSGSNEITLEGEMGKFSCDGFKLVRRGSGGGSSAKSSGGGKLSEEDIRKVAEGNTLKFTLPNGRDVLFFLADDGLALVHVSGKNKIFRKKWSINGRGKLCRTFGRKGKKHCTVVKSMSGSKNLTFKHKSGTYEVTVLKGKQLP